MARPSLPLSHPLTTPHTPLKAAGALELHLCVVYLPHDPTPSLPLFHDSLTLAHPLLHPFPSASGALELDIHMVHSAARHLPEPWSFIFTWFVVLPVVYLLSQAITNGIFKDFLILQGPCPNCGHKNVSFFGTILTVSTGQRVNQLKCEDCGSSISFDLDTRRITLEALPPVTAKGAPKSA
ncbi:unnamed protein product [Closterium sp. NIES-53]